jgi:hypothetical protein
LLFSIFFVFCFFFPPTPQRSDPGDGGEPQLVAIETSGLYGQSYVRVQRWPPVAGAELQQWTVGDVERSGAHRGGPWVLFVENLLFCFVLFSLVLVLVVFLPCFARALTHFPHSLDASLLNIYF